MNKQITVREALTQRDTETFWRELRAYQTRDLYPNPKDEDREYFLSDTEYRAQIETLHDREHDRCRYLFFQRGGQDIGFALAVIYDTEDGKCFLLEFCVFPEFRGNGTGTSCARAFLDWARENGAKYTELNCNTGQRTRFWSRVGFLPNGRDEWGEPLMLLPPEETLPISVEKLSDPHDWQLYKLENGFLAEIGEGCLDDGKKERLSSAIREGRIHFFLARRGYRAVGMCSAARHFSTFACADTAVFEDFYVEPAFRKQGAARLLASAVQDWCREQRVASLTVGCAPCDADMYRALGFTVHLGTMLAWDKGE